MLDLIIQNFHRRTCKKKQKQAAQSNATATPQENVAVEIDYDKLAEAMIRAEEKLESHKIQRNKELYEQQQLAWEKALKCQRYQGDNLLIKILLALIFPLRAIWGIIFFRKKDATTDNATYALFRICNNCMLWTYKWAFYLIAIGCAAVIIDTICPLVSLEMQATDGLTGYICIGLLCLIIGRIIRIAQLEAKNLQDKNAITVLFNALVAFTAMLLAIAAVIVALNTGGACTCTQ